MTAGVEGFAAQPQPFSEDALALEFTRKHGGDLRYVATWGKWLVWTGTHWRFDDTVNVFDHNLDRQ